MSAELTYFPPQSTQESLPLNPESGHSLDTAFPILAEIEWVRSQGIEDEQSTRELFGQELVHFAMEHAGFAKISKLPNFRYANGKFSYLVKDPNTGEVTAEVDMRKSWEFADRKYGLYSREWFENQGYREALKRFDEGAQSVIISSPQKDGFNRRFTFELRRDENGNVTQTNIMHMGRNILLDKAKDDYTQLASQESVQWCSDTQPQTIEEMLVRPIAFGAQTPEEMERIYNILGAGPQQQKESAEYQHILEVNLGEDVREYAKIMAHLNAVYDGNMGDPEVQDLLYKARILRDNFFYKAEEAKVITKDNFNPNSFKVSSYRDRIRQKFSSVLEEALYFASRNSEMKVYGGLVCETRTRTNELGVKEFNVASMQEIEQRLLAGESLSSILSDIVPSEKPKKKETIHCPACNQDVFYVVKDGFVHCLGSNKEEPRITGHKADAKAVCVT